MESHCELTLLSNLQTLSSIWFSDWHQNDTSKLTSLQKLKLQGEFAFEVPEFSNSIAKLENLRSLYLLAIDFSNISLCVMNSWLKVSKLNINTPIRQLCNPHEFLPSLTQLTLERTRVGTWPYGDFGEAAKIEDSKIKGGLISWKENASIYKRLSSTRSSPTF